MCVCVCVLNSWWSERNEGQTGSKEGREGATGFIQRKWENCVPRCLSWVSGDKDSKADRRSTFVLSSALTRLGPNQSSLTEG